MSVALRGITWNHTRGYLPMAATSQRFMESHPGVEITWEKRSLQEFADMPIRQLTERYDLLVIDHPWAGFAAANRVLIPLNEHVPPDFMEGHDANSVGLSHRSYLFDGCQMALAVDAAAPVSSNRPDLLTKAGLQAPQSWDELIVLARGGKIAFPGIPIDSLMNWYMLCIALGEEPFASREQVVRAEIGEAALNHLRELASYCTKEMFAWNPIAVYEAMSVRDDLMYCPFAYGYSNYARPGYSKHVLDFGELVAFGQGGRLRSTLGGTGLAISAQCKHVSAALEYAMFTADAVTQRTLYVENGGQPGHREAWLDVAANARTRGFFKATLPVLDRAYLRPRFNGYLHFQDHAGETVRDYMMNGGSTARAMERMNVLYRESLMAAKRQL